MLALSIQNSAVFVSIPERVLEALKRNAINFYLNKKIVSIPERVLEALKLSITKREAFKNPFQSLKGF